MNASTALNVGSMARMVVAGDGNIGFEACVLWAMHHGPQGDGFIILPQHIEDTAEAIEILTEKDVRKMLKEENQDLKNKEELVSILAKVDQLRA